MRRIPGRGAAMCARHDAGGAPTARRCGRRAVPGARAPGRRQSEPMNNPVRSVGGGMRRHLPLPPTSEFSRVSRSAHSASAASAARRATRSAVSCARSCSGVTGPRPRGRGAGVAGGSHARNSAGIVTGCGTHAASASTISVAARMPYSGFLLHLQSGICPKPDIPAPLTLDCKLGRSLKPRHFARESDGKRRVRSGQAARVSVRD
jgi:hypothetical protein